jgi:hypothetical protein
MSEHGCAQCCRLTLSLQQTLLNSRELVRAPLSIRHAHKNLHKVYAPTKIVVDGD